MGFIHILRLKYILWLLNKYQLLFHIRFIKNIINIVLWFYINLFTIPYNNPMKI